MFKLESGLASLFLAWLARSQKAQKRVKESKREDEKEMKRRLTTSS